MNICLVNNLFPPINTGSSFYTQDLAFNLSKKGHKVIVITNKFPDTDEFEIINNVKIYRLPVIRLPKLSIWMKFPYFTFSLTPKNLKKIRKIIKEENIEIIHQCNNIFDLVFASAYIAKKTSLPLICSLNTQAQHLNKTYNKIIETFDKTIIKHLFSRHVTQFIALDQETKRYIKDRYKIYDVPIIPLTMDPRDFSQHFTEIKDYSKNNYTMVSVGHVVDLRDRLELIKAWAIVVKRFPQAKLIIIGSLFNNRSGYMVKKLNLENNIEFTGNVDHKSLYKYFKMADIGGVFFPDKIPYNKGFGIANLESMYAGLPTLVDAYDFDFGDKFPIRQNREFVKVESYEPSWLAEKIIELFSNQTLRKEIGEAGQFFVKNILTWDNITNELLKLYNEIVNKKTN